MVTSNILYSPDMAYKYINTQLQIGVFFGGFFFWWEGGGGGGGSPKSIDFFLISP